ncbi:MAG TPA: Maf family protein [Gammaproteobacteria bacterium]|nr:Maf family protein [Gammaproteobacteria bacterium]
MQQLILASTSPFRRQLLERLGLPFDIVSPQTDETPLPGEAAPQLVHRLAEAKARAVMLKYPAALIIGGDQVAIFENEIIGKPGNHQAAVAQLRRFSGHSLQFHTGIALLNSASGTIQIGVIPTTVKFRSLNEQQITHYLNREQPYQCAGSFKSEGLGIALFESIHGDDPTALMGLPLITLVGMLECEGVRAI